MTTLSDLGIWKVSYGGIHKGRPAKIEIFRPPSPVCPGLSESLDKPPSDGGSARRPLWMSPYINLREGSRSLSLSCVRSPTCRLPLHVFIVCVYKGDVSNVRYSNKLLLLWCINMLLAYCLMFSNSYSAHMITQWLLWRKSFLRNRQQCVAWLGWIGSRISKWSSVVESIKYQLAAECQNESSAMEKRCEMADEYQNRSNAVENTCQLAVECQNRTCAKERCLQIGRWISKWRTQGGESLQIGSWISK